VNSVSTQAPSTIINTSAPTIVGRPRVGSTVRCRSGAWTNRPFAFKYGWSRNGVRIRRASKDTYKLQPVDGGRFVTCIVTAVGASGISRPATSKAVGVRSAESQRPSCGRGRGRGSGTRARKPRRHHERGPKCSRQKHKHSHPPPQYVLPSAVGRDVRAWTASRGKALPQAASKS
jgi:hypothetical protein